MSSARIAIEATSMTEPRPSGIGVYTRELVHALLALAEPVDLTLLYRSGRRRDARMLPSGPHCSVQSWRGAWWPLRRNFALVHATDRRLPPWRGMKILTTVYDVYAALGINFDHPQERERQVEVFREYARRSERILFISEHTRRDFLSLFPFDEQRTHVTHLGVNPRFRPHTLEEIHPVRQRYALDENYLLFVGLSNPNKNLPRLLEAYAASPARADCQLAIVGVVPDEQLSRLHGVIDKLGLRERVKLLGYVADEHLPPLYAGAAAYMFPSLYEGFGLPILEAMASGVPVLTSTVSSCPEVANGRAVLVDPTSTEAISAGIEKALAMTAAQRAAAREYALTKTWRKTAEQTLAVYRLAAAGKHG